MAAQADQAKLKKRLEALLKLPENQVCSDCRKRGPRWASANLGVFFCIECSGIHRNLGVHISFVRSVNLDTWTKQQVDFMEEWGNARANAYFEANVPSNVHRPKEGDAVRVVEKFIRDKYEFRRYVAKTLPPARENQAPEDEKPVVEERPTRKAQMKNSNAVSRPAVPSNAAPSPVAPAPSLLDFMDDPVPVSTTPVPQVNVSRPASQPAGYDFSSPLTAPATAGFDAFTPPNFSSQAGTPTPQDGFSAFGQGSPVPSQGGDDFMNFQSAPVSTGNTPPNMQSHTPTPNSFTPTGFPTQAPPAVPPKPQVSADSILSLYSSGSGNIGGMGQMGGGFGQNFGAPNYMNNMPPPPMMMGQNMPPQHRGSMVGGQPPAAPNMMGGQFNNNMYGAAPAQNMYNGPNMGNPNMMGYQNNNNMMNRPPNMMGGGYNQNAPVNPFMNQQAPNPNMNFNQPPVNPFMAGNNNMYGGANPPMGTWSSR